jgi:hypothetical protein
MTSDEARLVLHASRLGEADPNDPRIAEALEQARRDPELRAWFNEQHALDEAISQKLQQARVPANLAERIVAGRKASLEKARHRYGLPLALAASVALLLALGVLVSGRRQPPPTEFAAFRADMAAFLVTFPKLDLATDQWPEIKRWLALQPALADAEIPPGLQKYPGIGCREVQWQGKRLMLVCFAAEGEIVHLFVVPLGDLPGAPAVSKPALVRVKGWNTANWTQGKTTFVALTKGDKAFLEKLLQTPTG